MLKWWNSNCKSIKRKLLQNTASFQYFIRRPFSYSEITIEHLVAHSYNKTV